MEKMTRYKLLYGKARREIGRLKYINIEKTAEIRLLKRSSLKLHNEIERLKRYGYKK